VLIHVCLFKEMNLPIGHAAVGITRCEERLERVDIVYGGGQAGDEGIYGFQWDARRDWGMRRVGERGWHVVGT
jgi:hypothetical protein